MNITQDFKEVHCYLINNIVCMSAERPSPIKVLCNSISSRETSFKFITCEICHWWRLMCEVRALTLLSMKRRTTEWGLQSSTIRDTQCGCRASCSRCKKSKKLFYSYRIICGVLRGHSYSQLIMTDLTLTAKRSHALFWATRSYIKWLMSYYLLCFIPNSQHCCRR